MYLEKTQRALQDGLITSHGWYYSRRGPCQLGIDNMVYGWRGVSIALPVCPLYMVWNELTLSCLLEWILLVTYYGDWTDAARLIITLDFNIDSFCMALNFLNWTNDQIQFRKGDHSDSINISIDEYTKTVGCWKCFCTLTAPNIALVATKVHVILRRYVVLAWMHDNRWLV